MSDHQAKKNRRIGSNANALIQIALGAFALLFLTLSISSFAPRWDLTKQKSYSLSDTTTKLLASELMQKSQIQLTCLADAHSPYFSHIQLMLEEYQRLSKNCISLHFVDPLNNPTEGFKVTEKYKLQPTEDLLILDDGNEQNTTIIPLTDLMVFELTTQSQRKLSAYQVEDVLSTNLLSMLEENRRVVYLLSANTQSSSLSEGSIGATLEASYRNQNIDLKKLSLSEVDAVPDDAAGLLLLTPQYDLEPDEMSALVDYWNRPKASIYCILDPQHRPKRLRAFLRQHGITQRDDRVYTRESPALSGRTISSFTQGPELNGLLQGKSTLIDGVSSTLEVRESAEDLITQRIAPLALLQASNQYYGEARHTEDKASYKKGEDIQSPLYLAAAVIRGNENSDATAGTSARMVVLSTADFLKPDKIRPEQIDFVKNSINWLVGRPELIGIGPKPLQRYKLNLVPAEVGFINRLTLIILPLSFLLIALLVWNLRRS